MAQTQQRSRLNRWRDSLLKSGSEQEADDARAEVEGVCALRIDQLQDRQMAEVAGVVRSVTLPPRGSVPMLVVELFDGTRPLNLVWLGRRAIAGIEPGVLLRVTGRVTCLRGALTMYNPVYAILPRL